MQKITKLALWLLLASSTLFAESTYSKYFQGKNDTVGGIVGDTAIFVYTNNSAGDINEESKLSMLKNIARKQICTSLELRDVVDTLNLKVIYIYMNKAGDATILKINNCNGIEKPKKK